MFTKLFPPFFAFVLVASPLLAQEADAPQVDISQLLTALKNLREQKTQQLRAAQNEALQKATAAASSPQTAVAAWEEAVRQVQFEGASRGGTQFREWKDAEGSGLKEKEGQNAARLYYQWLSLTLQRASGASVNDLLPAVIRYARELMTDQATMEAFGERLEGDKKSVSDAPGANRKSSLAERIKDNERAKRIHDAILNRPLAGSFPVKAHRLEELVAVKNWANVPGDFEGIYNTIILPELRKNRDPRLLEYWDMKLRHETEKASQQKLVHETEQFNQIRRPELLWSRAKDELLLGKRNRAIGNMFAIIKNYPTHPALDAWIGELEKVLTNPQVN